MIFFDGRKDVALHFLEDAKIPLLNILKIPLYTWMVIVI